MAVTPNSAIEERRREIEKRRMAKRKKRRKAALKRFSIFLCIVAVATFVILSLTVFFPVKKISVIYNGTHYTEEQVIKASGIKKGENLWMTGSSAEEDLPLKLPFIESAEVERKFPSSITIKTKSAEPMFCFATKKDFYICDKNYKVLEIRKKGDNKLVYITGADIKTTTAGKKLSFVDPKKKDAIKKLVSKLKEKSLKLNSIDVSEIVDIKFRVENRLNVDLGSLAYFDGKISQLQEIVKNSQKDVQATLKLDSYDPENPKTMLKKE